MLKFLSKRKRSRKALLIVFVAVLALGLIGFFTPSSWTGLKGSANDDSVVAEVATYDVTVRDLRSALAQFGQQIAAGQGAVRNDDPAMIYNLYGQQILDNLIRQKLVLYEAERLHLEATDGEVQARLKQVFNPWPGAEQYRLRLQQAGMTPLEFEENLRASISEEKLRSYITASVQVSSQEVEEEYRRNNTSYSARWVDVDPAQLRSKVEVNDEALRAFFEQRKSDFRIQNEQRRARYIFIDQNKAGESIQVSDEDLRKDFVPERGIQQVRVSQIVLNVPTTPAGADASKPAATEEDVRKKAEDIVSRAQAADGKQAEDFAALARQFSEDAKTRANGGDIGWVNKKDKRESDDPLNRVFTMAQGEVSQPIRKGDKFYILKVTDRKIPTFEESREQLLKEARAIKGYSKAVEIATEAEQKVKESKNLDAVASEINNKYGAQVAALKETPFFAEGDPLPELGAATEFKSAIFRLQNTGDVTDRLNVSNGFAIAQYAEKRDPHEPAFEEVKQRVEESYRTDKAKELAAERARQLAQARTPDALKAAADSLGLRTEERAGIVGTSSIGQLISEADRARVYSLKVGEVTSEPIKVQDSDVYVVAALLERKEADMGEPFQKERKGIEERLLQSKRETFFSTFLAATQKRLETEGEIEIHEDVINQTINIAGEEGLQPQRPGAPLAPPARSAPRRTPQGAVPPGS